MSSKRHVITFSFKVGVAKTDDHPLTDKELAHIQSVLAKGLTADNGLTRLLKMAARETLATALPKQRGKYTAGLAYSVDKP